MKKLIRTTTVASSMDILVTGQLRFLSDYFEVVAVTGEDDHLKNVRDREGVRTFSIPMQRQISPLKDFVSLYNLYKFFKAEKPDIVHSMTPKAGLLSMMAAKLAGVPVRIHTFTGLIFPSKTGVMQKILIFMDKLLCSSATHIFPEGEGVKADLMRYQITTKPLKVIGNGNVNGVDAAHFNPDLFLDADNQNLRSSLGISPDDFVFIFIGRLVRDKGINELMPAFARLHDEFPSVKLLLVGPFEQELDPLKPETVSAIENHPAVITTGFQPDVRPYFALSQALVFPSYREGFPNVVLQSGAMGLPGIVTNINGCNEIITHELNGLIIPVRDEMAIFEAMKRMMQDAMLFRSMQSKSRNAVLSRFQRSIVWDALLHEYQKLS